MAASKASRARDWVSKRRIGERKKKERYNLWFVTVHASLVSGSPVPDGDDK